MLRFAVKFLSLHQNVQVRLRKERQDVLNPEARGTGPGSNSTKIAREIAKAHLPYLDAVIEEALRLGRAVGSIAREAMVDTQILGHQVPRSTRIYLTSATYEQAQPWPSNVKINEEMRSETSRRAKDMAPPQWDSANITDFRPERWLKTSAGTGKEVIDPHAGSNMAFSGGPRGCFGRGWHI